MSDMSKIDHLHQRIKEMRARSKEQTDAETKSLRKYTTMAHERLKRRLDILDGKYGKVYSKWSATKSYQITQPHGRFKDNALLNHIFQPLFDQEEPDFGQPIYVRLSTTTMVSESENVQENVVAKLSSLAASKGLPTIEMLARNELGDEVVDDLFQRDFRNSSLYHAIISFLASNDFCFPADKAISIPNRRISADLVMKSKYYPSRDDNRAYCADKNILRGLCGACLQKLFLPSDRFVRTRLSISKYVPAFGKDMLKLELPLPREGEILLMLLGDVSNFTGSAANAWLMLVVMALELSVGGLQNKLPNLFAVKDSFFTASWLQLLLLYLYLNVGYPCFVDKWNSFAYMPGGFLGVNGNITIALVWLSVVLRGLESDHLDGITFIKTQAGGDDFAIVVRVRADQSEQIKPWIEKEVLSGVGNLKELEIYQLDNQANGILQGAVFCRKRIKLFRSDTSILIESELAIPIPETLTTDNPPRGRASQEKRWAELDATLLVYDRKEPGDQHITSVLRTLYLDRCPLAKPVRVSKVIPYPDDMLLFQQGPYLSTLSALNIAGNVSLVSAPNITYLFALPDRIRHALITEKIEMLKVSRASEDLLIVVTRGEARKLRGRALVTVQQVGLVYDERLRNLLKS